MNNSIRIKSNKSNLKVVRDFVTNYLSSYTLAEKELNQIILAVDEITANLIIHANKEDESKYVKLAIFQTGNTFLFELSDNGYSFKPENYREPDIGAIIREGGKGGMGVALVKRIMDKVEFTKQGTNNICRLYKKVNPVASS